LTARGRSWVAALAAAVLVWSPEAARGEEISRVRFGAGVFEFNLHTAAAAELSIQYRGGRNTGPFHPLAGAFVTADGGVFAYAGFGSDISLGRLGVLRPSFGPGIYRRGNGKDLGAYLNFRTAVEIVIRLGGGRRLGLEMDHVSNAGAAPTNLGAESLLLTFALPLGRP
jgi:hypothetical protein